ncbi:hypothetical protein FACS1894181_02720 [Bacteroidia bacterium]|nr:hypothetical protein FACS1894181_02720 [Bacteroidia bacterium]
MIIKDSELIPITINKRKILSFKTKSGIADKTNTKTNEPTECRITFFRNKWIDNSQFLFAKYKIKEDAKRE